MAIVRLNDCEKFSKVVFYSNSYSFDVNLSSRDVGCAWRAHTHTHRRKDTNRNDFFRFITHRNQFRMAFSEKRAVLNHPANGITTILNLNPTSHSLFCLQLNCPIAFLKTSRFMVSIFINVDDHMQKGLQLYPVVIRFSCCGMKNNHAITRTQINERTQNGFICK